MGRSFALSVLALRLADIFSTLWRDGLEFKAFCRLLPSRFGVLSKTRNYERSSQLNQLSAISDKAIAILVFRQLMAEQAHNFRMTHTMSHSLLFTQQLLLIVSFMSLPFRSFLLPSTFITGLLLPSLQTCEYETLWGIILLQY